MTNEKRLKRLQEDLTWLQIKEAKHIAKTECIKGGWDDKHPNLIAAQDAYSGDNDMIGDIQNVINDIADDESGGISQLIDQDPKSDDFVATTKVDGNSKDGYSVQLLDKVSGLLFWVDVWVSGRDVNCDWNQYIFQTDNEEDMKRKTKQENCKFFADAESTACEYLETIGAIVQNDDGTWRYGTTKKEGGK